MEINAITVLVLRGRPLAIRVSTTSDGNKFYDIPIELLLDLGLNYIDIIFYEREELFEIDELLMTLSEYEEKTIVDAISDESPLVLKVFDFIKRNV